MGLPDQVTVPYTYGYNYGMGVNYASGLPKQLAVKGRPSTVPGNSAPDHGFRVFRVKTMTEIEQALEISVDARYGFAAFGAGAEARFNFARSMQTQSASLIMVVKAWVRCSFEQIDRPELTEDAGKVRDPKRFADTYGNMFVRGIAGGGLFIGYIRIHTGEDALSETIAGELQGSYGLASVDAKAKFERITRQYRSELETNVYCEGGPIIDDTSIDDPNKMLVHMNDFLHAFATNPDKAKRSYSVTLAPLSIALAPEVPNAAAVQHASDVTEQCARSRSNLIDKLNRYQYIVDNPDRFDFSNGANLAEITTAAAAAQHDLTLIARCAGAAIEKPESALMPQEFAKTKNEKFELKQPQILPKSIRMVLLPDPALYGKWVPETIVDSLEQIVITERDNSSVILDIAIVNHKKSVTGKWDASAQEVVCSTTTVPIGVGWATNREYHLRIDQKSAYTMQIRVLIKVHRKPDRWEHITLTKR